MNGTTLVPADLFRQCRATAFERGLEAALEQLAAEFAPERTVGHGGRAMLPEPLLARFADAAVTGTYPTDTGALALAGTGLADPADEADWSWRIGVAWVRVGAVERFTRTATDRLSRRRIGGNPTITLPLVRAAVGDVAAALGQAVGLLDAAVSAAEPPPALVEAEIGQALRTSWKFFGASGYVVDTASDTGQAITLLSDVYSIGFGGGR
ncbi:MAG TPA: hypothetical protein VFU12_13555 [Glycomyces sp.]|nr:hypothetical protein [Glycomyces sp.]